MVLTVALEEACLNPDYPEISTKYIKPEVGQQSILAKLIDIHGNRLKEMDQYGNEYQVLSLTSPGPQGEPDVAKVPSFVGEC
jgi:2,3-dihydroxybenzoate decarboxylase